MKARGGVKRRRVVVLLLAGLLLPATGCINTKQTVWLNPDGSGRMALEAVQPLLGTFFTPGDAEGPPPEEQAREQAAAYLRDAVGVDAWSDVSWELTDDFKLRFRATILFPDFSAVDIPNLNLVPAQFRDDGAGGRVLLIEHGASGDRPVTDEPEDLSAEEVARRARNERAKFSQVWSGMSGFIAEAGQEAVFHLPGRITEHNNLALTGENSCRFRLDGQRLVAVINELAADESWWRDQVRARRNVADDGPFGDEALAEKLFGERGPVRAVAAGPLEPLFNYEEAVAGARAETGEAFATLGLTAPAPPETRPRETPEAQPGETPAPAEADPDFDPGAAWSIEHPLERVPEVPLAGSIFGHRFALGAATVSNHALEIESRERIGRWAAGRLVIFGVNRESVRPGRSWTVTPESEGDIPHVHMHFAREGGRLPGTLMFTGQYSMRLVVEEVAGDSARLRLHISLPDYRKSHLVGVFSARLR